MRIKVVLGRKNTQFVNYKVFYSIVMEKSMRHTNYSYNC